MSEQKRLHLFTLSISPVQSFIAEARKARDLFAGSRLLSELAEAAMLEVEPKNVIVPQRASQSDNAFPNQFTAEVEGSADDIRKLAEDARKAVVAKIKKEGEKALANAGVDKAPDAFWPQLNRYFSVHWAAVPIDGSYLEAFKAVQRKLAAAKNLRRFEQSPELGRKCSLTASDNALFFMPASNGNPPAFAEREWLENKLEGRRPEYLPHLTETHSFSLGELEGEINLLTGEGLSATAFVKRFFSKHLNTGGFESTADIAAMDYIEALQNTPAYKDYKKLYEGRKIKFDGQLLYKENISTHYFEKQGIAEKASPNYYFIRLMRHRGITRQMRETIEERVRKEIELRIDEFTSAFSKLEKLAKEKELRKSSYYALLLFDTDGMGNWLSGKEIDVDKVDMRAYHRRLSENLSRFTADARRYINEEGKARGQAVYAGGDDFLGFLNLSSLFATLAHLRRRFDELVNTGSFRQEFGLAEDQRLSFSAGLVIAHYKAPLSEVIKETRRSEGRAKDVKDKDSIAITTLKHSGETERAVLKWTGGNSMDHLLNTIRELDDNFSTKFIRVLYDELRMYEEVAFGEDMQASPALAIVQTEARRLVHRSCNIKDKEKRKQATEAFYQNLMGLFDECNRAGGTLDNFLSLLKTIDFLKRKASI